MSQRSRTEYSVLNILTGFGGYFINTVVGFVCRIIFVRCLTDDYLGINGLFSNILSMLSLAELGIGSAIVYALYKPLAEGNEKKIASLMRFYSRAYTVIGCVVAAFGLLMIPFLSFVIQDPPDIKENIYFLYVLFLFNTSSSYFFSYRASLLMAAQKSYIVTTVNYLFTIGQSMLQIVFLLITREYLVYLVIQIISCFCNNIVISIIAKKQYPCIVSKDIEPLEKHEKKSLVSNVRALTITKLSGLLVNNTDNIIITYFSGIVTVGLASNYTLLSGLINTLLTQLFGGVSASVGNYNAIESRGKKLSLFNCLNFANFWLFGWAAIGIFVVSGDLVELLYGSHYVMHASIPFVIALNFYMVGMQNAVWVFKSTMGLFRQGRYLLIVTAALNLVFSIVLGKIWGLFGILFATAISRLFTNTWYDPYAVFKYGFGEKVSKYYLRYICYGLLIGVLGAACYFICSLIEFYLIVDIILKIIVCTVIPNGVFILLFHRTEEFKYYLGFVKRIKTRVFKR